jgi:hypothetical protein
MTVVEWYRNGHEHRNDMLRFGMMRLHQQGDLKYREYPLSRCVEAGFPASVADHEHRHTSVLAIRDGRSVRRVIVDSEDSFFWMSPLVHDCDVYFCSGYSRRFFVDRAFIEPYRWQTEAEIAFYSERAAWLIDNHGSAFSRVKPFVPIAPNMGRRSRIGQTAQRLRNLRHKATSWISDARDWAAEHSDFEERYRELLTYREASLRHDIVLMDSLWGWPRHRVALHAELARLSPRYTVHSRLNWSVPSACDAGDRSGLRADDFPKTIGKIDDYETMLSQSRLGVFATGFHYGWRNIMTLALMMGLPVLTDRLNVEPWFDMEVFYFRENEEFGISGIEVSLKSLTDDCLDEIKRRNRRAYDSTMSPEIIAKRLLREVD